MLKEFRDFIMKGNILDLAVAVVIGTAFTAVVTAVVKFILMPIVGIIFGEPTFDDALILEINGSKIFFGSAVTALVNFVIIAFAMFVILKAVNKAMSLRKPSVEEELEATEVELLAEIRDLLSQRGS
jgi:large conductance mechanosensitive channel